MRPKKVILCVDSDESALSVMKFMLETNGYRVIDVTTAQEAIEKFSNERTDLVMAQHQLSDISGNALIGRLKEIAAFVPMILLAHTRGIEGAICMADALAMYNVAPLDLLASIKVLAQRKCGPRKGSTRAAQCGKKEPLAQSAPQISGEVIRGNAFRLN